MNLRWASDTMLLVEWESAVDPLINQRAIDFARELRDHALPGVRDIVPGFSSVGVHLDPLRTDAAALEQTIHVLTQKPSSTFTGEDRDVIEIPVRYGGADGPDLEEVARWAGGTLDEVVSRHSAPIYRVYMLGFVPGFAYLGRVDRTIAAPRRRSPRPRVPPGSVGVAGEQTGIYPIATPGGWQLIGRTEAVMFDPARDQPSLLQPGAAVRFIPIDRQ